MGYKKEQNKWIKNNDIHLGSRVKVFKRTPMAKGLFWIKPMDGAIGFRFKIKSIEKKGIKLNNGYIYPYTSLKSLENKKDDIVLNKLEFCNSTGKWKVKSSWHVNKKGKLKRIKHENKN